MSNLGLLQFTLSKLVEVPIAMLENKLFFKLILDESGRNLLSILVRKLLKRGTFSLFDDLRTQTLAFIAYDNRTMAKPIKWTYTGLI